MRWPSATRACAQTCDEAEAKLAAGKFEELPPGFRNSLAQLHGDGNRIMANKLDAILTGDLNSGRDCARAKRKELLKTTEAIIVRVEEQVKRFDAMKKEHTGGGD